MSKYDYPDLDAEPKRSNAPAMRLELWDLLSILVLLVTVCIAAYFVLIFMNPFSQLNPLKPIDPNAPPTATPTPLQLAATWTASPTIEPTTTPRAPFSGSVTSIASTIIHPESACNWLGVGGTVVDTNNSDVIGIVVRLVGTLNGKHIEMTQVSGVTPAYGKSGFEFFLGSVPLASNDTLYVQLLDLASLPLSDNIYIDTFNDCSKNMTLVRFKKNR